MNPKNYIEKNRTILFDWIVFTTSFFLGFIFPTLADLAASPVFSWLMLISFLLYIAGAVLKRVPLYDRMFRSGISPREIPYKLFLFIGHWMILFAVILLSQPAVSKLFRAGTFNSTDSTFVSLILSVFITWLVFDNKKQVKKQQRFSENYLFRRELIADIFLLVAVSFFTFAFWEKGILSLLENRPSAGIADIWFLFVFLSIAYMLYYLPLRYLFLVEDHTSRQTWQRMLFFFGLLLIRSLLVMLDF